jgi:hypothetical protein
MNKELEIVVSLREIHTRVDEVPTEERTTQLVCNFVTYGALLQISSSRSGAEGDEFTTDDKDCSKPV